MQKTRNGAGRSRNLRPKNAHADTLGVTAKNLQKKSMKIDELKISASKNDSIPRWISQILLNRKHRNQFKCNYALSFVKHDYFPHNLQSRHS